MVSGSLVLPTVRTTDYLSGQCHAMERPNMAALGIVEYYQSMYSVIEREV
jgi:hypothetical protein